ncbi:MAG: hypothetical protein H6755_04460 [Candidatus Omnitrophica bacterium]|nr:hypothetical protein [Candidatus Omnitrophota bacterium]
MKKYLLVVVLSFVLTGCAEKLQGYIDQPESFFRDPHYDHYKNELEAIESAYLKKEMSYAQYLDKKQELENKYSKEVQEREAIIESHE